MHHLVISLFQWIKNKFSSDRRMVTLTYPRFGNREIWEIAVQKTMDEFNFTFLRGNRKKLNLATGATKLRRLFAIGGDRQAGIAYHAHGIIDGLGSDEEYFNRLLHSIWKKNINKLIKKHKLTKFRANEALVYSERIEGDGEQYLDYILRPEGNEFGKGLDKVLWGASNVDGADTSDFEKSENNLCSKHEHKKPNLHKNQPISNFPKYFS